MKRVNVSEECHICKGSSPPKSSSSHVSVRSLRSAKPNIGSVQKVNWIKCDCCKKWFHSVCCGLLLKEHSKLARDTQFFKCVFCCLRTVPEIGRKQCLELLENTKLIHSDLHTSSCSNIDSCLLYTSPSPRD